MNKRILKVTVRVNKYKKIITSGMISLLKKDKGNNLSEHKESLFKKLLFKGNKLSELYRRNLMFHKLQAFFNVWKFLLKKIRKTVTV